MTSPRYLSGPPPPPGNHEPAACRKCDREFHLLVRTKTRCNHCGYFYCSACTGYTALMPRSGGGHEPVPVCASCADNLNITASPRNSLKAFPLAQLKKYANAYDIPYEGIVIEKDDLVDRLVSYRRENGCLPPENEDYYRKHSVPNLATPRHRGLFSRHASPPPVPTPEYRPQRPRSAFPRPDVQPQSQPPSQSPPQPASMPRRTQPQAQSSTRPQQSNLNIPQPDQSTRPRATSRGATTQPQTPTLDELLNMPPEDIKLLTMGVLKRILDREHIRTSHILEKSDLVDRVTMFITEERDKRHRELLRREEEEWERVGHTQPPHTDAVTPSLQQTTADTTTSPQQQTTADATTTIQQVPRPTPKAKDLGQVGGTCVICTDNEADIAVVDCGHMAMCMACSKLIMESTRECPMCRTRIVTEQRLLKIFKV